MSVTATIQDLSLIDRIDAILPQTQCRRCGYGGCQPYAQAIAQGQAEINQCPPGGELAIHELAQLLGIEFKPLNPAFGEHKRQARAFIDENTCIGCTLCIQACPVDAIVGAPKQMHTVIVFECTGCELCVPPCPVDCITLYPVAPEGESSGRMVNQAAAELARQRYRFRLGRFDREKKQRAASLEQQSIAANSDENPSFTRLSTNSKQAMIEAAMKRAKERVADGKT